MHDRSNGLGGGFAGYGIYPEYKNHYAFHVFYDTNEARVKTEDFLDRHFDIVNLSRIPINHMPEIKNEPMIKAILTGHLHFSYESMLTPSLPQYVTGGGYNGIARELTLI